MTTTSPSSTTASPFWTGARGEFRPPRYASPQRLTRDGRPLPTAGSLVARFQERWLVHGEGDALGSPVRLPPFWRYILARLFEYEPETGDLAYDRIYVGIPKGNDKTEGGGRLGVCEVLGPIAPLRSPRVVLTAASYDQTKELFGAATLTIKGDPEHERPGPLWPYFAGGDYLLDDRILVPNGVGRIERLAAVGGTNDGGKPTAHIGDEIHELDTERKERSITVQGKSLRKRRVPRRTPASLGLPPGVNLSGALQIGITTAGFSLASLAGRLYEHGRKVASGEVVDPGFLFLWWEADEHWDLTDYGERTQAILQANPAVGEFLPLASIHASYLDVTVPELEFLRYNLNRWPGELTKWLPRAVWSECEGDAILSRDLPVRAAVSVAHDHRSVSIALAQLRPDGTIALRVRSFPETPLPLGETVEVVDAEAYVRGLARRYPAPVMGVLPGWKRPRTTPGPEVVYSGAFFEGSAQKLRRESVAMLDVPETTERLAAAAEALRGAALEGRLEHDGDSVLAAAIDRVTASPAPKGWTVHEATPPARAAMVAVHRAVVAALQPSRTMRRGSGRTLRRGPDPR